MSERLQQSKSLPGLAVAVTEHAHGEKTFDVDSWTRKCNAQGLWNTVADCKLFECGCQASGPYQSIRITTCCFLDAVRLRIIY